MKKRWRFPFSQGMNDGAMIAEVGKARVGSKKENSGSHTRFAVVLLAANDVVEKCLEVLFKAVDPSSQGLSWRRAPLTEYPALHRV